MIELFFLIIWKKGRWEVDYLVWEMEVGRSDGEVVEGRK
jgi:hypothetical protein